MRRERILTLVTLMIGLALGQAPRAFAAGADILPGSRYVSARGAAMGDAFLPWADDGASALMYNPAAIARLKGVHLEPMNVGFISNTGLTSAFGTDFIKFPSLSGFAPVMKAHAGRRYSGGAAVMPSFAIRGIAFGLLAQGRIAGFHDGTNVTYRSKYQLIPTAGIGWRLASGVLRFGYSLQWVHQVSGEKTVADTSTPLGWNEGLKSGQGFSHNVGFALTLPYIYQPALNIVGRNVLGLKYSGKAMMLPAPNSAGTPETEDMSIDAALSFVAKLGNGVDTKWSFQYRDVTDTAGVARLGHLAAGAELSFQEIFMLRAGYSSAYPSVGLGIKTDLAEMSLSFFSEEVGNGLRDKQNKNYMMQFILRAF